MAKLGIKELKLENWMEADLPSTGFAGFNKKGQIKPIAGDDWAREILAFGLKDSIPPEIHVLYETAKGAMVYGWFFYPLYTLGMEQLSRVAEAAISARCQNLEMPKKNRTLAKKIHWLADNSYLSEDDKNFWNSIRKFRNWTSHANSQSISTPGNTIGFLGRLTERMNALFTNS